MGGLRSPPDGASGDAEPDRGDVLASLAVYVIVYAIVFGAGVYYLVRLVQRGISADLPEARIDRRPARPLSAATPPH